MSKNSNRDNTGNVLNDAIAMNPVFGREAREQMGKMVEAIARSDANISQILSTDQAVGVKGGFIAEEFHAETFNLDAILKKDNARAYTDRYEEWPELKWNGANLQKNDVPNVVVSRNGKVTATAQAKYYNSAETTAAKMSPVKDGKVKYGKVSILLGPDDQINSSYSHASGENEPVATTTVKEHAEAKADALKSQGADKTQIKAYRQTAAKSADKISDGKVSSTPLSKADADKMGAGDMSKRREMGDFYKRQSTAYEMTQAGMKAGAYAAISTGVKSTLTCIQMVNEGKITKEEAARKIINETVVAATESCIKAAATTAAQSTLARYSETMVVEAAARQGINAMVKTNAVTVGVKCAVDAVKDLVRLGTGEISSQEFFDRQGKGVLMTSAGLAGGVVGTSAGAAIAASFGASSGSAVLAIAETLGGISGGLIAGIALTIAIENGVEKPYRDLVRNTENLRDAALEMNRLAQTMVKGQFLFTKFLEADAQMEAEFNRQMRRVDEAGQRAYEAINRI